MHRLRNSQIQLPESLPAVGRLINQPPYTALVEEFGRAQVVEAIREQVAAERKEAVVDDDERSRRVSAGCGGPRPHASAASSTPAG